MTRSSSALVPDSCSALTRIIIQPSQPFGVAELPLRQDVSFGNVIASSMRSVAISSNAGDYFVVALLVMTGRGCAKRVLLLQQAAHHDYSSVAENLPSRLAHARSKNKKIVTLRVSPIVDRAHREVRRVDNRTSRLTKSRRPVNHKRLCALDTYKMPIRLP